MVEKNEIWISDLTHTQQGNSSWTFPLGASFVYSYAKQQIGSDFEFKLFKFPKDLAVALNKKTPSMLCFSNYSWNFELGYKFALLAKQHNPNIVTVFGGPNFPTTQVEKLEFLQKRPSIDFYIELEGEIAFVDLAKSLMKYNLNVNHLKNSKEKILNTCYVHNNEMITGQTERIKDINIIPSPYLTGALDEYFNHPLIPMLETTRGCPFSCTFCADGDPRKNRTFRYDAERTQEELVYIAKKVKDIDELIITDLNFAMYKSDIETAKMIAKIQKIYNFPTLISASPGKNLPKRTMEVGNTMKGWNLGAAIQSTDPEVLKNIKRSNISTEAYKELIDFGNSSDESRNKTESAIILAMPGDTKQKHYESLRFGVDNNVKTMKMFQAMLLPGTEMASRETREKFKLKTKFRIIPGALGMYDILNEKHPITEIEEIIVGNNTLSEQDYLDCRIMNLFIATFYNNSMFEEVFIMLRAMNISRYECLLYLKEHPELYSDKINEILKNFVKDTTRDLFDSWEEANNFVLSPEIIDKYIGGDMGTNELLENRSRLFNEFDDVCDLMLKSVEGYLKEKNIFTARIGDYLIDLKKFLLMRKKNPFINLGKVKSASFMYDFEAISEVGYNIDPNSLIKSKKPLEFNFFHDQQQKNHISNQLKLYSEQAVGLGKMLQQSNMQLFFRNFQKKIQQKTI